MGEPELLNRLKAGDRTAFGILVKLYENKVINICYRFLLDKQDAEDIAQEVFIEVYRSIKLFKGNAKLSTWIYRIAISKSLDELKKRNRKKRLSSLGKMLHIDDLAHLIAGGKMPDTILQEKEGFREIMQALNSLPDNQRVAFTLSKIDGYSNTEIAEIMNTTTIAVESLIYRAKKNMTDKLNLILKNNS